MPRYRDKKKEEIVIESNGNQTEISCSTSEYLSRTERIKEEQERLTEQFADIPIEKKNLVMTTISDVAFMTVTMQDLREKINREGTEIEYQNGANQWGTKQSPSIQSYMQMSQKQTAAMKILVDCLPKAEKVTVQEFDDFDDFIEKRE